MKNKKERIINRMFINYRVNIDNIITIKTIKTWYKYQ